MAKKKVWVQLYVGNVKSGTAFQVASQAEGNIDDLKQAVYQASPKSLDHCDPHNLDVYQAGTEFPQDEAPLDADKQVSSTNESSFQEPLRVVAPTREVNQQHAAMEPDMRNYMEEFRSKITHDIVEAMKNESKTEEKDMNYMEEFRSKITPDIVEAMKNESKTEEKDMSRASTEFATGLLKGLGISWRLENANMAVGLGPALQNFEWEQKHEKGGSAKMSENDGTPKALEWLFGQLEKDLAVDGKVVGIRDVKGKTLAPVEANRKRANGKSDGCISEEDKLLLCEDSGESFFTYGMALVEMKTNKRKDMNKAQMLLQLASFSRQSIWRQSTVLLGTDGSTKWYLSHFESCNSISITQYQNGRQCLNDLESLLKSMKTRHEKLQSSMHAKLATLAEEPFSVDQDLAGFSDTENTMLEGRDGARESQLAVDRAIENESFLHHLANALYESPLSDGVRPSLPEWALAKNVVPLYYS